MTQAAIEYLEKKEQQRKDRQYLSDLFGSIVCTIIVLALFFCGYRVFSFKTSALISAEQNKILQNEHDTQKFCAWLRSQGLDCEVLKQ